LSPPIEPLAEKITANTSFRGAQRREPLALRAFLARKIPLSPYFSEEGFLASLEMTVPWHFSPKLQSKRSGRRCTFRYLSILFLEPPLGAPQNAGKRITHHAT
jgi:hypothetical protein